MKVTELPSYKIIDITKLKRKNFSISTENKSCYVLSCRTSGSSLFSYNGGEHIARRGDVLYIPSGASYSQRSEEEELVCIHLQISGRVADGMKIFSVDDPEKICALFERAQALWSEQPKNFEYSCMSVLYEIIAVSNASVAECRQSRPSVIEPAMRYLDTHIYDRGFSLKEMCAKAPVCRTHFNKLFHKAYGCAPLTYINEQRIARAKQFILNGSYTNEEIAELCGFCDVKYFYVVFKRLTGLTTKEYKNIQLSPDGQSHL